MAIRGDTRKKLTYALVAALLCIGSPLAYAQTAVDCGGSIAAAGVAQNLSVPIGASTQGFFLGHVDTTEPLCVSFTGTAVCGGAGTWSLLPATVNAWNNFATPSWWVTNHTVSVVSATAGHKFQCTYQTGTVVAGSPVITVPGAQSIPFNTATAIPGVSVSETNSQSGETFTVTLADTNGNLALTGSGVTGSGTNSVSVNGTLSAVNTVLGTLTDTSSVSGTDTITVNASDSLGGHATAATISVTVAAAPPPTLATFDPANTDTADLTLSNGNLTAKTITTITDNGAWGLSRATNGHTTGKYYAEFAISTDNSSYIFGVLNSTQALVSNDFVGDSVNSIGDRASDGTIFGGGASGTTSTVGNGHTGGMAVDLGAKLIWFRQDNGLWNNNSAANPATGVGGIAFTFGGTIYPGVAMFRWHNSLNSWTANFGATAYAFTPPSGFGNW